MILLDSLLSAHQWWVTALAGQDLTFLSVFSAVQVFSLQIPGHFPGSVEFHPVNAHLNTCALKSFLKLFLCPVFFSLEFCLHEVHLSQHTQTQVSIQSAARLSTCLEFSSVYSLYSSSGQELGQKQGCSYFPFPPWDYSSAMTVVPYLETIVCIFFQLPSCS